MKITPENLADMNTEDIEQHGVDTLRQYPYGLNPADWETVMRRAAIQKKDSTMLAKNLVSAGRIKFEMSQPEYRTLERKKRKQMVYISVNQKNKAAISTLDRCQREIADYIWQVIADTNGIKELKLRAIYLNKIGNFHGYREIIYYLLATNKIKTNEKPKTGKIKTIYTAN